MHSNISKDVPKFDIELLFDEIGVLLDDNQYRDAISLVDMYHFYTRQHQVRVYFLFSLIAVGADPCHAFPVLMHLSYLVPLSSCTIPIWSHLFDPTSMTPLLNAANFQRLNESGVPPAPTSLIGWIKPVSFIPFLDLPVFRLSQFPF